MYFPTSPYPPDADTGFSFPASDVTAGFGWFHYSKRNLSVIRKRIDTHWEIRYNIPSIHVGISPGRGTGNSVQIRSEPVTVTGSDALEVIGLSAREDARTAVNWSQETCLCRYLTKIAVFSLWMFGPKCPIFEQP